MSVQPAAARVRRTQDGGAAGRPRTLPSALSDPAEQDDNTQAWQEVEEVEKRWPRFVEVPHAHLADRPLVAELPGTMFQATMSRRRSMPASRKMCHMFWAELSSLSALMKLSRG